MLTKKQQYILDQLENWSMDDNKRNVVIAKDFDVFRMNTISSESGEVRRKLRIIRITGDNSEIVGEYSSEDPSWKLKFISDAGLTENDLLDDVVAVYFVTKRLTGGKP